VEARTWVKKLKKQDIHEEEKEDDGVQINNLVELGFLKREMLVVLLVFS
jgi:hypothetical protein